MASLKKRFSPQNLARLGRVFRLNAQLKLSKVAQHSPRLSSFFYLFASTEFDREHHAVIAGKLAYEQSLTEIGESSALLRRNIHRVEKGLIMRPRRAVFGKDYIGETLTCYKRCLNAPDVCTEELQWAFDVLQQYFEAVDLSDAVIAKSHKRFVELESRQANGYTPYKRSDMPRTDITSAQFAQLCRQRRSVRWYQDKAVEIATLEQAVTMASQAPSACNRQPFYFYTATESQDAVQIAQAAMGTKGFDHNIPAVIVVVGDLSAYPFDRDRHLIYIDSALASMQLMLSLETLGLSSCPINWPDIEENEQKMSALLGLKPYERPIMLISVGYADDEGMIPYSQKKTAKQLIRPVSLK